jgi:hypothetical protein
MNHSSRRSKTPANLSDALHHRLNMYALAAGAAGVGMLALAQPSEAKIVYTPIHRIIGNGGSYNLHLRHDGITDFTIRVETFIYGERSLAVQEPPGNAVVGSSGSGFGSAFALNRGALISPKGPFVKSGSAALMWGSFQNPGHPSSWYYLGRWDNVRNRYLGLQFQIKGKTHYGWARLTIKVQTRMSITATLTGYAYETIPGKAIIAGQTKGPDEDSSFEPPDPTALTAPTPQTATLGLLAMGSPALSIWRRKEPSLGK